MKYVLDSFGRGGRGFLYFYFLVFQTEDFFCRGESGGRASEVMADSRS